MQHEDYIFWGQDALTKYPIMPKGMQMVCIDDIVDIRDLQQFKIELID